MFRFLSVRLEKWFSHQVMSIAGCVIIVLGVIISAFPFLPNLYIGLGVFLGTGGCLCAISGVLEINKRFTGSSRGLAHGFSLAGNTVGGLVLPALIAVMMDRYGYTGALLLLSAVILNIIPASLLYTNTKLRPVISDGQPSSSESGKEVFRNSRLWFCIFSMASTTVGYTNFGLYLPLHLHSTYKFPHRLTRLNCPAALNEDPQSQTKATESAKHFDFSMPYAPKVTPSKETSNFY